MLSSILILPDLQIIKNDSKLLMFENKFELFTNYVFSEIRIRFDQRFLLIFMYIGSAGRAEPIELSTAEKVIM